MNVDIEAMLTAWLPTVATCRAVTELPADLVDAITADGGVVRVTRIGGPDTDPGLEHPTVDVECFHTTRAAARNLARDVQHQIRYALPGHKNADGWVTRVRTLTGPSWRPYDDLSVRRFGATYQISTHSPA